jgi:pentose-5-phosphate-3-epimerase
MPARRTILIIGIAPHAVDYSDPAIPPGMNAEKIAAGLAEAQKQFADQGDRADLCMLQLDGPVDAVVAEHLGAANYDCVVIGAGLRKPEKNLKLFETVINAVHRHAPRAAIAFNTTPHDSALAAERALG